MCTPNQYLCISTSVMCLFSGISDHSHSIWIDESVVCLKISQISLSQLSVCTAAWQKGVRANEPAKVNEFKRIKINVDKNRIDLHVGSTIELAAVCWEAAPSEWRVIMARPELLALPFSCGVLRSQKYYHKERRAQWDRNDIKTGSNGTSRGQKCIEIVVDIYTFSWVLVRILSVSLMGRWQTHAQCTTLTSTFGWLPFFCVPLVNGRKMKSFSFFSKQFKHISDEEWIYLPFGNGGNNTRNDNKSAKKEVANIYICGMVHALQTEFH